MKRASFSAYTYEQITKTVAMMAMRQVIHTYSVLMRCIQRIIAQIDLFQCSIGFLEHILG